MSESFVFYLNKSEGKARLGELTIRGKKIQTPVFMPVASQATVKTLSSDEIREIGFGIILSNTYHLYLRPGIETIENLGGLHKYMDWDGGILTDSGGYQVFSLSRLRKLTDEGVVFRSHIDGSEHLLTPEMAIKYQESLGSDIAMVLDECPAHDESYDKTGLSMKRTHLWARRCLDTQSRSDQALFAIVQGGVYPELRQESAEFLTTLDFPGYAIGGLSLGEPKEVTAEVIDATIPYLPEDKPRYLMGVGSPEDLFDGVSRGIDIFDCVLPTRVARNGSLFTEKGRVNILNARFTRMEEPVDTECDCYCCRTLSASYLHHLFNVKELLAYRLATLHNLTFISNLMKKIRTSIQEGTFDSYKKQFLSGYQTTDEQVRISQKEKWLKSREDKEE
ncbi:MAG: tRNA guanosine(34) transglycosylase Tgt [Dehalococcoidales bacterium]|nr:MAG: tRNA guanosine(34) transglycosylase Tgt [Dehalococcoidales bacterium]